MDKLMKNYSLEDINVGFEDSASGKTVKPVVVF
jgi:aryl-alcohol dehydrogenase